MKDSTRRSIHPGLAISLVCVLLAQACASGGGSVTEQFVADTATTLSAAGAARVYARTDIRYSRSGRDYLYLGPVETNRQGLREYFLWVAWGSTVDRGYLAPRQAPPVALHVMVQGELMEFELHPWQEIASGSGVQPPYRTPVEPQREFGARVTLNQLELLSAAGSEAVSVHESDGSTRVFRLWDDHEGWRDFISFAAGNSEIAARADPAEAF